MWLSNYNKLLVASFDAMGYGYNVNGSNRSYYYGDVSGSPVVDTSGNARNFVRIYQSCDYGGCVFYNRPNAYVASQTAMSINYHVPEMVIGSGTTPAAASDYRLESEITNLSCSSVYTNVDQANGTVTYSKTMINLASDAISVSEIGLVIKAQTSAVRNQNNSTEALVMYYREVLDEPIVVEAGASFTVAITHQFPVAV